MKRSTPLKRSPLKRSTPKPVVPVGVILTETAKQQKEWCKANDHPQDLVNASRSTSRVEYRRCRCGAVETQDDLERSGAHGAPTNGRGSKGPDSSCIPLSRHYHDEMDGKLGTKITTKEQFATKYGLDLADIAAEHYERYQQEIKRK